MALYEKYGEFDSYKEINMAAANQKSEGDMNAIKEIAKENGIDEMDAEDFINGDVSELCSPLMAAAGKIKVEKEAMNLKEIMADWADDVVKECENEAFALAVRRKGKSLAGAIGAVLKESWKIKEKVPSEIKKAAGIHGGNVSVEMGIPGRATVRKILKQYYLEG